MSGLAREIYRTGIVHDAQGNAYPLAHQIDEVEAAFLTNFIAERPEIARTLEVGCAFGLSSLHITDATKGRPDAHHTVIDPFQADYHGVGLANLERAGVSFELIEEPSELALPRLLGERPFDLVFIDGWHTFDHTLVDLFYANRLIKVGGFIIVDDCNMPGIAKAVDYVSKYPAYRIAGLSPRPKGRILGRIARALPGRWLPRNLYDRFYASRMFPTMVALQKVTDDGRDWRWFEPF